MTLILAVLVQSEPSAFLRDQALIGQMGLADMSLSYIVVSVPAVSEIDFEIVKVAPAAWFIEIVPSQAADTVTMMKPVDPPVLVASTLTVSLKTASGLIDRVG